MTWLTEGVAWYLVLAAAAWGFAPVARVVGGRLPDRGATIARPVALLAVVYPTWLLASLDLIQYSTIGLWGTLGVGAVAGWAWAWRRGLVTREWLRALLVAELVFLVAFAAYVALRGYTPRITGTEKPMDVAFLAASARTAEMPPPDPWFAGEPINYYYLGYLVHGALARMAEVPSWYAFNLALASTFGMTVTGAAGLGFNLVRSWLGRGRALAAAGLAAFLLAIAGNLHAPLQLLRYGSDVFDEWWWAEDAVGGIGWQSSRVVTDYGYVQAETINEFPYFSFLLGDLHPHVTALPFTLLALAVAFNLLRSGGDDGRGSWVALSLSGIAVGALYPLNSWDFPTYLLIALAAVAAAWGWSRETVGRASALAIAAVVAWLPFTATFVPFAGGNGDRLPSFLADLPIVGRLLTTVVGYGGEWTSVGEFLTVFGVGWAIAVVYLGVEGWREWQRRETRRFPGPVIAGAVIVALVAIALPAPVVILAGAPLAVAVWLLTRSEERGARSEDAPSDSSLPSLRSGQALAPRSSFLRTAVAGCFAAAFGLVLVTEFFYVQDVFDGRYNTLFKVYYQVWTLLAIGGAAAFVALWRTVTTAGWATARSALAAGLTVAVAAGLVYPVVASEQWTEAAPPRDWHGLNGAAFIDDLAPDDLEAIGWLNEHAREDDVLLEAPGCQYQVNGGLPTSRFAAFTGVPTVAGQKGAELQWRGGQPELLTEIEPLGAPSPREQDAAAMYADPQSPLFEQYGVTLLVVGFFEREGTTACEVTGPYPQVNQPDYPGPGWEEVFASGETRIYRRAGE